MRHRAKVATFGRKSGPRTALLRGLVNSLVEHGRIKTSLAKAKELRRHIDRAVTVGKRGLDAEKALHIRRLLMSRYPNEATVSTLMSDIAPRMKTREGGYTRILKIGMRPGDRAEMAYIEFVDYKPSIKAEKKEAAEKDAPKLQKARAKANAAKKKALRQRQNTDRQFSQARARA